jgi:hypothetical protein
MMKEQYKNKLIKEYEDKEVKPEAAPEKPKLEDQVKAVQEILAGLK